MLPLPQRKPCRCFVLSHSGQRPDKELSSERVSCWQHGPHYSASCCRVSPEMSLDTSHDELPQEKTLLAKLRQGKDAASHMNNCSDSLLVAQKSASRSLDHEQQWQLFSGGLSTSRPHQRLSTTSVASQHWGSMGMARHPHIAVAVSVIIILHMIL